MGAREYEEDDEAEEAEEEEPEEEEEPDGEDLYEEEEDEDDEEEELPKRKRKHKRSLLVDDAAEEDDEEEAPRKRKSRKTGPQLFIDDAAVVASDDDEEEEDSGEEDFLVHDHTEIPEHESIRRMPSRTLDDMDDPAEMEKIEKSLQERYKRQDMYYDEGEATEVEQQALLPSVKDPKLWMLSCPVGREREAVVCLMQKYLDLQERGEPLLIKSSVAIDHLKGYLYVESERENYVKQAIKGLRSIFSNTVKLVPIKEMTHVLTVDKKSVDIDKENWVRVKLGLYKGDLAKVLDVDHVRQRARIKLVPRIDLAEVAAKMEGRETVKSKRAGYRPSQRFINIQDVKDLKIPIERKRDAGRSEYYDVYAGMMFVDGYHVKTVALKSLNAVDVVPSLDELQSFQKPGEEDGVDASGLSSSRKRGQFMKGDTVVVIEGDLKNLYGVVEKVDEENVEIRPKESGLRDILKFNVRQLSKFFRTGDHVKVISGKHDGATGMIVKVEAEAVVILSDTTKENIRVFKSSIVESSEVTCGLTKLGEFELHDLIALDQTTVGVIVRIESDGCQVLKGTPDKQDVITVKQRDLRRRIFNKNVSTQDRDMNVVNLKDIVRVVDGPFKSKQGPVEHINRGVLFIQDRHHLDNGGFICVRASSCIALGGTRGGNRSDVTSAFSQMRPPSQYLQSPRRSPTRGGGPYGHHNGGGGGGGGGGGYGGGGGRGGGGRQQGNRRNDLLGRTVKIRLGPFKGYRGRVVDANDGNVRIELESQMKVVTVRRDQLSDVGDMPPPVYRENPRYGMGSETPIHPSRTPMHNSAFMTPMRDLTMTPMHDSMRTPMRDRAWNPTATPLRDSGSEDNSWNSRATSPQYQPGTPLANRSYEAPTPGSGWASTPGGNYSDSGSPAESASSYGNPTSPYMPGTPGALPMTPAVPSYLAATPGGQPMTPGNGVLDPTSPAGGYQEADRKWALPDLVVTIRKGNMVGVIKEVGVDGICRVGLGSNGEGEVLNLSQSEMEMVMPRKNDKIKIVHGEWFGKIGKVIGIDGGDGIVRIDDLSHDVKILEMEHIAKAY